MAKSKLLLKTPELRKLEHAFKRYCKSNPNPSRRYPRELRSMAVKAKSVCTRAEICQLIGVSKISISKWIKEFSDDSEAPKCLRIVSARSELSPELPATAQISIGSRIQISVPASELSAFLIGSLLEAEVKV
jgi:DNA-binding transcriptional regulator YdaS (Cro superfamily)